jgi:hypothetical protein
VCISKNVFCLCSLVLCTGVELSCKVTCIYVHSCANGPRLCKVGQCPNHMATARNYALLQRSSALWKCLLNLYHKNKNQTINLLLTFYLKDLKLKKTRLPKNLKSAGVSTCIR